MSLINNSCHTRILELISFSAMAVVVLVVFFGFFVFGLVDLPVVVVVVVLYRESLLLQCYFIDKGVSRELPIQISKTDSRIQ